MNRDNNSLRKSGRPIGDPVSTDSIHAPTRLILARARREELIRVTRSERAALSVLAVLPASAVGGATLVELAPRSEGEALLIASIFLPTVFAAVSAYAGYRIARARRVRNAGTANRPGESGFLSPRQVMILTLGLTAVAALTGTGTGARIIADPGTSAAAIAPSPTVTVRDLEPTPAPAPTISTQTPTPSPIDSSSDTGSPSPTDSGSGTPAPGATTYLDSASPVNGRFGTGSVSMSGNRYPRSISMSCQRASYNIIEWNVAGYHSFSAMVGIGDDTSNAFAGIIEIIFYDQDGRQLNPPVDA